MAAHKRFGRASYYDLPGNRMADGRMFGASAKNAAMLDVPLGTVVKMTDAGTKRSIDVTVTDRGPYEPGRIMDLTSAGFKALTGNSRAGLVQAEVDVP